MDYTISIPIKKSFSYEGEFECICKNCRKGYDHMHCWTWHICNLCKKKVWFNIATCSLYSRRIGEEMICFNCRIPYYKRNMTSGEIHRLFRTKYIYSTFSLLNEKLIKNVCDIVFDYCDLWSGKVSRNIKYNT